ncbi:MAG: hypothetical protein ACTHN5_11815 [Phycisphaerae bacterium]
MEFGPSLNNPLLQAAVSVGETTIRHACDSARKLHIHVEMEQFPDGRDAIRVTLRSHDAFGGFCMLLRNFFDHTLLNRVARHAWQRRIPCGHPSPRALPIPIPATLN